MKAREVETFDDDLERLVERMTALMHEANGVGLAATQVGVMRRLFVFATTARTASSSTRRSPRARRTPRSTTRDVCRCATCSFPVERAEDGDHRGRRRERRARALELEPPASRVVQHELDHLDGVLIIDRTDDESRRAALARLRPQPVLGAR